MGLCRNAVVIADRISKPQLRSAAWRSISRSLKAFDRLAEEGLQLIKTVGVAFAIDIDNQQAGAFACGNADVRAAPLRPPFPDLLRVRCRQLRPSFDSWPLGVVAWENAKALLRVFSRRFE